MLAIPLYIILFGLTVWGLFSTSIAGWGFFGFVVIFATLLLMLSYSLRSKSIPGLSEDALTLAEQQIFRRYSFYFLLPFQAKQFSSTFSFVQMLCLIWVGLCLWKSEWVLLGAITAVFFVAARMASFLNQGNFLRVLHSQGKLTTELIERMEAIYVIEGKVLKARGLRRDETGQLWPESN